MSRRAQEQTHALPAGWCRAAAVTRRCSSFRNWSSPTRRSSMAITADDFHCAYRGGSCGCERPPASQTSHAPSGTLICVLRRTYCATTTTPNPAESIYRVLMWVSLFVQFAKSRPAAVPAARAPRSRQGDPRAGQVHAGSEAAQPRHPLQRSPPAPCSSCKAIDSTCVSETDLTAQIGCSNSTWCLIVT